MIDYKVFCEPYESNYRTSTFYGDCNYNKKEETNSDEDRNMNALTAIYGQIVEIVKVRNEEKKNCYDSYLLTIQDSNNEIVNFVISNTTYMVDCSPLEVGANVIGYYDSTAPMPLIYPPQYRIEVLAYDLPGRMVKADFFNCFLVSDDNALQLSITNNTYIVDTNGTPYCDNISNKYMVVLYSSATKSIPAKTQPNVVIVLS